MEHKFIIEVRLRHEPPTPVQGEPEPQPQSPPTIKLDPKILNALLPQILSAVGAMQPHQHPKNPKK